MTGGNSREPGRQSSLRRLLLLDMDGTVTSSSYVEELTATRQLTLQGLAQRDDVWLEAALPSAVQMNAHWAWFHVAEDEIKHRGQIRWLRARLPR